MHRSDGKWYAIVVGICGLILCLVGGSQLLLPTSFFDSSGITLPPEPGLYSLIRVGGSGILLIGLFMLISLRLQHWRKMAGGIGAALYLGAALARLVSHFLDGAMTSNLYVVFGIELVLGLALLHGQKPLHKT